MLKISNLTCNVGKKNILKDVSLEIEKGQIVAIMGPNGSGKSSLAQSIMGNPDYSIEKGTISFNRKDITKLEPDERAKLGIFLAFQYPLEVGGVDFVNFLRLAYNSIHTKNQLNVFQFRQLVKEKIKDFNFNLDILERNLNEGFSGGEKKKAEILQMAILKPKLVILDETDSGLDVDALKIVFNGIKKIKKENKDMSILLITHYNRVFEYLKPDKVYAFNKGSVVRSGGIDILKEIDEKGYKELK